MKTFASMLKRHGFVKEDLFKRSFAGNFLNKTVTLMSALPAMDESISEATWISFLEQVKTKVSIGRETLIDPVGRDLPLADIDLYIRGVTRWLNKFGVYTTYSCDGHDRRSAYVYVKNMVTEKQRKFLQVCAPENITVRFARNRIFFRYPLGQQELLLDFAERLYDATNDDEILKRFEADQFKLELIKWLSVPGVSGNERRIRTRLQHQLQRLMDTTTVDRAGNLLATLDYGEGPTVLLSAHMDIAQELFPGREILQSGTVLSSTKGILGADDRAGITAVLAVLRNVRNTHFSGTIKVAFTVKEEIGCIGAESIDESFLQNIDGAIVFDRRGKRDIITSYANYIPFCPHDYGELFEKAGELANMSEWKVTSGGLSDTRVFASYGIPGVNLSVGYHHEHTDDETVDYVATYETVKLVESVLHHRLIQKQTEAFNRAKI
jgi:tripeptide aminopeptidase